MSYVRSLSCRDCGQETAKTAVRACPACGEQLDPVYDWDGIASSVDRDALGSRPRSMWRYRELLPLDQPPTASTDIGCTPLLRAPGLAKAVGVSRLWIKHDGVSYPTLSFKDRVVAVAINKARELRIRTVAAPSTGNLANAVAAHAAAAGMESWILVPHDLETGKLTGTAVYGPNLVRVCGTYDEINRLIAAAAERFGWGVVNGNLRPYYGEGSKTVAFETAEQLAWRVPTAVVAPMAGGSLVTKLAQGFRELVRLGWTEAVPRVFGTQAAGSAPIVVAVETGADRVIPVTPQTIARSLAIGDPVDGRWAARAIRDTGGWAAAVTDEEVVEGITLLARTTGIFAETAGGVTVSGLRRLVAAGKVGADDEVVLCLTGNGMKTVEVVAAAVAGAPTIPADLEALAVVVQ